VDLLPSDAAVRHGDVIGSRYQDRRCAARRSNQINTWKVEALRSGFELGIRKLPIFKLLQHDTEAVFCCEAMVRLTTEVVAKAPSYINPIKDRELDLRGNRIPAIENLAVSKVCPSNLR
jgi:hypothetical protein